MSFDDFLSSASQEDLQAFVSNLCGGSWSYMYQLKSGHRKMGWQKAGVAAEWFKGKGYDIPRESIRPDVYR